MSFSIKSIQKKIPPLIFKAGKEAFERESVTDFKKSGNRATALVKGFGSKVFKVGITFETRGRMRSECSCPDNRLCKHVVAVLFKCHAGESGQEKKKIEQQKVSAVLEKQDNPEHKSIDLFKKVHLKGRFAFLDKELISYSDFSFKTNPGAVRHRAVFYLKFEEEYKKHIEAGITGRGKSFRLSCCLGMQLAGLTDKTDEGDKEGEKKAGCLFTHFNKETLTEKINSPEEIALFNTLILARDYKEDLRLCPAGTLISGKTNCYLYRSGSLVKAVFKKAQKAVVTFRPDTLDSLSDDPLFSPVLTILTEDGKEHPCEETPSLFCLPGFVLLFRGQNEVFYFEKAPLTGRFLTALIAAKGGISAGEIKELEKNAKRLAGQKEEQEKENTVEIDFPYTSVKVIQTRLKPQLEISEEEECTIVDLLFDYGGKKTVFGANGPAPDNKEYKGDKNRPLQAVVRNRKAEIKIKSYLNRLFEKHLVRSMNHLSILQPKAINEISGAYPLYVLRLNMQDFLAAFSSNLAEAGFELLFGENKKPLDSGFHELILEAELKKSDPGFFELRLGIKTGETTEQAARWDSESIKNGRLELGNRFVKLSDKDSSFLEHLLDGRTLEGGRLFIPRCDFDGIKMAEEKLGSKNPDFTESLNLGTSLQDFKSIEQNPLPVNFKGTLRDYQKAGYFWLSFLHTYKLGGCLADDMGLGKTVQTLSLLQSLKEAGKITTGLLVAPVSTLANWEHETSRFTPGLTYYRHHGPGRKKSVEGLEETDLVIVSYHTLRTDKELFTRITFSQVILDESHYIKNPASQIFKAVTALKTDFRLCLTGTPVENTTGDLWAQMHFLNPGLLGTASSFRENYSQPIESEKDEKTAVKLKKKVSPFILRRKKEDVAKDLPEKEEIVCLCEMAPDQLDFYNNLKEKCLEKIQGSIEEKGVGSSTITILDALLKLRQAALFPVLCDPEQPGVSSAKFNLMEEMLTEILAEDHKVLIFSQFVSVLGRIKNSLENKRTPYAYLDGSTRKRDKQIKLFQEDKTIPVFLLSLKAAGVGINLTAADYVFLFDPWWNPAVENQAVDRAHRIGQKRRVIVYRFIVKDTIEEKIMLLKERKKALADNLIVTEESFFKSLTKDDLQGLFE